MTTHDDFDGRLTSWLVATAPPVEPDGLADRVLGVTARTDRRPAWRIPERWIPMATITTPTTSLGSPPWRTFALLAVLLVGLVGGAILLAGAQRTQLPPPFGLAANGVIVYSIDGSIVTAETPTSDPTPIITDGGEDGLPWFAPDGQRFSFVRGDPESPDARIWIANADGSDAHEVVGAALGDSGEWSPRGDLFAMTTAAVPSSIILNRTDGSGSDVIETGLAFVEWPTFRPPDGATITFRGRDANGERGIYQIGRDGSGLVRLALDPGFKTDLFYDINRGYYFNDPIWDPTGQRLLYHTLEPAPGAVAGPGFRLHVAEVDPAGVVTSERIVEFDPLMDDEFHATFLPDGERIIFETIEGTDHQLWVSSMATGATPRALGVTAGDFIHYLVSPDGTQLIATLPAAQGALPEVIQVDIATGAKTRLAISDDFTWQRRAMPSD